MRLFSGRFTLWIGASAALLAAVGLFLIFDAKGEAPVAAPAVPKVNPRDGKRPAKEKSHPLDPAMKIAYEGLKHIQSDIDDYTAIMQKRERVDGELVEQKIFAKVRCRKKEGDKTIVPMSVYVKVLEPKSQAGREAIWVENRNDGKMVGHEVPGFRNLFRVNLRPDGFFAMMGTRYPITDIGLDTMVERLIEKGERDRHRGECQVEFIENVDVGGQACTQIVVTHPVQRDYFDFHIAEIFIDKERNVPLRYEAYTWPTEKGGEPVLQEEVIYTDLKLNVGLTEKDFDPDNKDYKFP